MKGPLFFALLQASIAISYVVCLPFPAGESPSSAYGKEITTSSLGHDHHLSSFDDYGTAHSDLASVVSGPQHASHDSSHQISIGEHQRILQ